MKEQMLNGFEEAESRLVYEIVEKRRAAKVTL
jgi:hypothetical protein